MIFPGFPGVLSFFQVFQVEWESWINIALLQTLFSSRMVLTVCLSFVGKKCTKMLVMVLLTLLESDLYSETDSCTMQDFSISSDLDCDPLIYLSVCLEQRSMPKMGTVTIWEKELNPNQSPSPCSGNIFYTRMHSSRMRTIRRVSRLPRGGCAS